MAVYVDDAIWGWQGLRWAHLVADDEHELHRFAAELGLSRLVYQGPPRTAHAHYDITAFERRRAHRARRRRLHEGGNRSGAAAAEGRASGLAAPV